MIQGGVSAAGANAISDIRGLINPDIDSKTGMGDNISDNSSGNKKIKSTKELLKETTCSSDDLYRYIKNIDKNAAEEYFKNGNWPDGVQIPKSPDVLDPDGKIDWKKVPKGGYILDSNGNAIKQQYTPYVGEIIDRFGPSDGRYTSPFKDGKPYTYDQRSLPYVEDQSQYHKYIIKDDLSKIQGYVEKCTDPTLKKEIEEYVDYWYNGDYSKAIVYTGEIAKVDGFGVGGGIQYELPIPIDWLVKLHLIEEI